MTRSAHLAWASWPATGEYYRGISESPRRVKWSRLTHLPLLPVRIVGLYVSIVLVVGKFVRGFFSEISHSIMFEELPCVDRILKLCQDIFLVRETRELELEEELYAKLIFLYRSPETMIKWTRERE